MDTWWQLPIDAAIILILILGIAQFRTAPGARAGNLTAALALLCALAVVLHRNAILEPGTVVLAFLVGGLAGAILAQRVSMLQIPATVAFQHGAGGIAAFVVSLLELTRESGDLTAVARVSGILGIVIGAATFSGSMVASGRLSGVMRQAPTVLPGHQGIVAGLALLVAGLASLAWAATGQELLYCLLALVAFSILLGIAFAIRIGGADMPVLISFLNATAGLAAAFCGIAIHNRLLIACGATVAASGSILTHAMCRAMNRSLFEVFVPSPRAAQATAVPAEKPQPAGASPPLPSEPQESPGQSPLLRAVDAAKGARKVIVIPGYGMALAHAQFEVVKLVEWLRQAGKDVKFAIHPIAGRMPGHMHVLLAEAEADPDLLFDMADIDAEFPDTDLALVVGACDVVNPAAIHVEGTPISGMPILSAHLAKQVLVCNLDGRPGYSGVENSLYTDPKTILLFGDAKASLRQLLEALDCGDPCARQ